MAKYGKKIKAKSKVKTKVMYKKKALGTIVKYDGKTIMKGDKGIGSTGDRDLDDLIMQDFGDIDKAIKRNQKMVDDYPEVQKKRVIGQQL